MSEVRKIASLLAIAYAEDFGEEQRDRIKELCAGLREDFDLLAGRTGQALSDLARGSARVQCLVAGLGEQTIECGIDNKCLACMAAERVQTAQRVARVLGEYVDALERASAECSSWEHAAIETALAYPDQDSTKET